MDKIEPTIDDRLRDIQSVLAELSASVRSTPPPSTLETSAWPPQPPRFDEPVGPVFPSKTEARQEDASLTDEDIEQCWNEAERDADCAEEEWMLYGRKVEALVRSRIKALDPVDSCERSGGLAASTQALRDEAVQRILDLAYAAAHENQRYWHDPQDPEAKRWIESDTYAALKAALVEALSAARKAPEASRTDKPRRVLEEAFEAMCTPPTVESEPERTPKEIIESGYFMKREAPQKTSEPEPVAWFHPKRQEPVSTALKRQHPNTLADYTQPLYAAQPSAQPQAASRTDSNIWNAAIEQAVQIVKDHYIPGPLVDAGIAKLRALATPPTVESEPERDALIRAALESKRVWPFVETPGEFTERLQQALTQFDLLGAVRNVLIENPPTLYTAQPSAQPQAASEALARMVHIFRHGAAFTVGGQAALDQAERALAQQGTP